MSIGSLVWWWVVENQPLWGRIHELEERPGVKVVGTEEIVYLDRDQLHMPEELPDGVYANIPDSIYHSMPHLSSSGAKLLLPPSVPAKFKWRIENPVNTPAFDFGKLVHKLVLGTGPEIAVMDPAIHGLKKDGTVADNPAATSAWKAAVEQARARDAVPIHVDEHSAAEQMRDAVLEHPIAGPLFESGDAEFSLFAHDPETGVGLRARPDWMVQRDGRLWIVDLKTCVDGNPDTFGRTAMKWSYDVQMAWYVTVARLLRLDDAPMFAFVLVEKQPPYLVSVTELDMDAYLLSKDKMREAISTYKKCLDADEWPGYEPEIHTVSLPLWAFPDEEMVV